MKRSIIMKFKSLVVSILCIHVLLGCEQNNQELNSKIELFNAEETKEFSVWLKKANIKYKVDNQGVIWYGEGDVERVLALVELAVNKGNVYSNETLFGDTKYKQYFLEEMKKANINYMTEQRQNGEWVIWNEKENLQVSSAMKNAWERRKNDFFKN